nr:MAG TPA: hypothetical protein [Caudoviricetes sp.]
MPYFNPMLLFILQFRIIFFYKLSKSLDIVLKI